MTGGYREECGTGSGLILIVDGFDIVRLFDAWDR